jgi:hypothetical protein
VVDINVIISGANELTHCEDKFVVVTKSPLKLHRKGSIIFSPN